MKLDAFFEYWGDRCRLPATRYFSQSLDVLENYLQGICHVGGCLLEENWRQAVGSSRLGNVNGHQDFCYSCMRYAEISDLCIVTFNVFNVKLYFLREY